MGFKKTTSNIIPFKWLKYKRNPLFILNELMTYMRVAGFPGHNFKSI